MEFIADQVRSKESTQYQRPMGQQKRDDLACEHVECAGRGGEVMKRRRVEEAIYRSRCGSSPMPGSGHISGGGMAPIETADVVTEDGRWYDDTT
jgi:hypothetical protein